MLTREEFAGAVQVFKDELSAICVQQNAAGLDSLPGFNAELREAMVTLHDPASSSEFVLSTAWGLVDEFLVRSWEASIAQAYDAYLLRYRQGGESAFPRRGE